MAKIALTLKVLFIWLYNGFASVTVHSVIVAAMNDSPITQGTIVALIFFFLGMVFLPEILFVTWPKFRLWIMQGAEDGDGILNTKDLKEIGFIYVSLWSMRIFMGFSVAEMFGAEIDIWKYGLSLAGSFGLAGLAAFKNIVKK